MKCPHCGKDIKEQLVMIEAARIGGRRSKRTLSPEAARAMARKRFDKQPGEEDTRDDDNG